MRFKALSTVSVPQNGFDRELGDGVYACPKNLLRMDRLNPGHTLVDMIVLYIPGGLSKELLKYLGLPELKNPVAEPAVKKRELSDVLVEAGQDLC